MSTQQGQQLQLQVIIVCRVPSPCLCPVAGGCPFRHLGKVAYALFDALCAAQAELHLELWLWLASYSFHRRQALQTAEMGSAPVTVVLRALQSFSLLSP
jgi:hypothetical protein